MQLPRYLGHGPTRTSNSPVKVHVYVHGNITSVCGDYFLNNMDIGVLNTHVQYVHVYMHIVSVCQIDMYMYMYIVHVYTICVSYIVFTCIYMYIVSVCHIYMYMYMYIHCKSYIQYM